MVSQTFADNTFGVLLALSHSERESGRERVGTRKAGYVIALTPTGVYSSAIDTTVNPTGTYWVAWMQEMDRFETERESQNEQLVLQYAPNDNITATLDYTLSRFEEISNTNKMAFWFDNPTGTTDANGTLVDIKNANDELNFWAWELYEKKKMIH
ncbi:hypothetical protein V6260_01715 [Pseudoalteromonas aliena]|uniref:hypothetical protein n=1 Tax=Pseudoalteromonas aliena TaxID=247523 RepID=UPI00311FF7C2